MAFKFRAYSRTTLYSPPFPHLIDKKFLSLPLDREVQFRHATTTRTFRIRVSDASESYLHMWKKAVESERKSIRFQRIVENSTGKDAVDDSDRTSDDLEKKNEEFNKILEVPKEERDRIQRLQVIDRAAAAIAAARALIDETESVTRSSFSDSKEENGGGIKGLQEASPELQSEDENTLLHQTSRFGTPGPDFWSWTPPPDDTSRDLQTARKLPVYPKISNLVEEKEPPTDFLSIPFESKLPERKFMHFLPPLQSSMEVEKLIASESSTQTHSLEEDDKVEKQFSVSAAEALHELHNVDKESTKGISPDGSRWWKVTGVEKRPDGVICKWTLTRGVSADQLTEWQNKYWEAADVFGYKELGSEKSGRDASGNVWREYWRESMWQERGLLHLEKTADKWGKNGYGSEWQEKWWEQYNASGQTEKRAHKWCKIDPSTYVDDGHAHIWHERWGEKYDGLGSSIKYTDKWAERCEGDGWTKWGDKWDENFGLDGHGVKQGETWWEGKHGERWNRTWGEGHNGSGWIHKYGKSSSGEHWDTHEQQETWYEKFPHYGFIHCFNNSVQLREVPKPSDM